MAGMGNKMPTEEVSISFENEMNAVDVPISVLLLQLLLPFTKLIAYLLFNNPNLTYEHVCAKAKLVSSVLFVRLTTWPSIQMPKP